MSDPVWSPDGQQIAYAQIVQAPGGAGIGVMDADGTDRHLVRAFDNANPWTSEIRGPREPAWSPDGTRIAYTAIGYDASNDVFTGQDLRTVAPDGTGDALVAHFPNNGLIEGLDWQPLQSCSFPGAEASPATLSAQTASAAAGPPAVGNWLLGGCWRKTGATTWESDTQITLNGLLVTPDSGARVVVDSSVPSLRAVGQVTVETGTFTTGGTSRPSIVLFHGGLNWSLSAAQIAAPLAAGLKLIGLSAQDSSATLTPGPTAGGLSIGPITVALPDLIGGTGAVTLKLTPSGVQASSWQIGPTARLLGGLLPVQGLTLAANEQGWGVGGQVVIAGSPGSTLGGSISYTGDTLSGASVTAGGLELFGGALPVRSVVFAWSAQRGWHARAEAMVPGQSDSTASVDLTYSGGVLQAGELFLSRAALGSVARLENVDLSYTATPQPQWTGSASVVLAGPSEPTVTGSFVLRANQFVSGSLNLANLNLGVGPSVRLTRLQAAFNTDPWQITGGIGISAGPEVDGHPAVRINGNGTYSYPAAGQGGRYHVDANVLLADFELLSGSLDYRPTGRTEFEGHLGPGRGFSFPGVTLSADLTGWVDRTAGYSAQGNASMTINGLAITGRAVVSSTGIAACGGVRDGWTWEAGLGYRWVGNQLTVLASGCDLRPWTTQAPSVAAADAGAEAGAISSFTVPAGEAVHAVRFTGTTAPPRVRLSGPAGESYVTPSDPADLGVQDDYVVVQDAAKRTTTFLLNAPSPGTWRAFLQSGSSPVAKVATAKAAPRPEISAAVTGTGTQRTLTWNLTPLPGQTVTFVEKGPETTAVIASTSAASGQVPFLPADGPAGTRELVAVVSQDGMPRGEVPAGSYEAAATATVTVERSGSGTVTSNPTGINCGTACAGALAPGTQITLTASPAGGRTFAGWSGPCEGTGPCTFTVDTATTVTATFVRPPTSPSVTGPTGPLQKGNGFTVRWGGATDPDGSIAGHDVRYRSAGLDGVFGQLVSWQTASAATSARFTGDPARTYCFSARAIDDDGATSPWSAERCTATPVDDRDLTAAGFTRRTGTGNLADTYSEATARNATLAREGVTARRIGVLVQRCHGCGTLQVRHAGQLLGTIQLEAPATQRRVRISYTLAQVRTGPVTLTVTSNGKPVRVDGIIANPT